MASFGICVSPSWSLGRTLVPGLGPSLVQDDRVWRALPYSHLQGSFSLIRSRSEVQVDLSLGGCEVGGPQSHLPPGPGLHVGLFLPGPWGRVHCHRRWGPCSSIFLAKFKLSFFSLSLCCCCSFYLPGVPAWAIGPAPSPDCSWPGKGAWGPLATLQGLGLMKGLEPQIGHSHRKPSKAGV